MDAAFLVINAGSSSIKFAFFIHTDLRLLYHGQVDNILDEPRLIIVNGKNTQIIDESIATPGYEPALKRLCIWLENLPAQINLKAIGHRVVHGGTFYTGPTLVTAKVIQKLISLTPLAPLHQPHNIAAIQIMAKHYPGLPQVACFDTSFHQTQQRLATLFAIPAELSSQGIIRYGFHGISYEYIASVLPDYINDKANGKVIVAHLGHGASMCAMKNGKSVATSMGFTALDGLVMGTRCGSIDPGVILYLLQEKKFTNEQVTHLLYQESGLLGVSGISDDMRVLQASKDPKAIEAVELFCYSAVRELGALCAQLHGCDAIIFTGGIGEHSALVRKKMGEQLAWLGVVLDEHANSNNRSIISHDTSSILVSVIPTDEEYMIAKHTQLILT